MVKDKKWYYQVEEAVWSNFFFGMLLYPLIRPHSERFVIQGFPTLKIIGVINRQTLHILVVLFLMAYAVPRLVAMCN